MSVAAPEVRAPGGSDPDRRTRLFDLCVRLSVYFILLLELGLVTIAGVGRHVSAGWLVLALVAAVLHTAANLWLLSWTLSSLRISYPARNLPRRRIIAVGATGLLLIVVVSSSIGVRGLTVAIWVVAISWAALCPALSLRIVLIGGAVIAVALAASVLVFVREPPGAMVSSLVGGLVTAFGVVATVWLSAWMLRVFYQLDAARADSARLAVAEERLRISRDLHDVFGRTLATVAVKSELAAQLARHGRVDEAADEMAAVRGIADQAGQEVRKVLRGYREANLAIELQGARSLLAAAGITCEVRNEVGVIGPAATSVLAWATREAVTNLIKHADARSVSITLAGGDPVIMTVVNDGVREDALPGAGQGLLGMTERVAEADGTVEHNYQRGQFRLRVELPNPAEAAR
jgi:two-component system sensor histidine kinase DesK